MRQTLSRLSAATSRKTRAVCVRAPAVRRSIGCVAVCWPPRPLNLALQRRRYPAKRGHDRRECAEANYDLVAHCHLEAKLTQETYRLMFVVRNPESKALVVDCFRQIGAQRRRSRGALRAAATIAPEVSRADWEACASSGSRACERSGRGCWRACVSSGSRTHIGHLIQSQYGRPVRLFGADGGVSQLAKCRCWCGASAPEGSAPRPNERSGDTEHFGMDSACLRCGREPLEKADGLVTWCHRWHGMM